MKNDSNRTLSRALSRTVAPVATVAAMLIGCSSAGVSTEPTASSGAALSFSFTQLNTSAADVGNGGGLAWVTPGGREYIWQNGAGTAGSVTNGLAIDVGALGVWAVESTGVVSFLSASTGQYSTFTSVPMSDIGVSPNGQHTYAVGSHAAGSDGQIYLLGGSTWEALPGQLGVRIDASNDGTAWVSNAGGQVWHVQGTVTLPISTPIAPAGGTCANDITVGSDGTVYVVGCTASGASPAPTADADVFQYIPASDSFTGIPGAVGTRLSADGAGNLAVVNAEQQLWVSEAPSSTCIGPMCSCNGVWTGSECAHICPCGGTYPSCKTFCP